MPTEPDKPTDLAVETKRTGTLNKIVTFLVFCYAIGLIVLFLAMELLGERWWPLAVLLYLPQRIFLLPLIVLVPAALFAEVSVGTYTMFFGIVIIFLWHVPFYPGIGGGNAPIKVKVITNNYAQNHRLPIQPFITAEDPDFVALEDATGEGPVFQRAYPGRNVRSIGQFVLISKAPIKSAEPLNWPRWRGDIVGAVFEVPWQGQDLAVYAIHLPTPRTDFAKLTGLGLVKEMTGHNRRASDGMSFAEAMTGRVELARELGSVFAHETRPLIAMGDFNTPPDGYNARQFMWGLTDCFARAGRGFGFTFPGDTNNPLTLGGPWLRIDYILAGPGWQVNDCKVEPDRRSKHRAVAATLSRGA
jgi:vancomycin resistance protein VanJ